MIIEQMTIGDFYPTAITFYLGNNSFFSITRTEMGFDVSVPDGVTMTECAKAFVDCLRDHMRELRL